MTFKEIVVYCAKKTALYNRNTQTVMNSFVNEDDIKFYANLSYKKLFSIFAEKYPDYFRKIAIFDMVANRSTYPYVAKMEDASIITEVGLKYNATQADYDFAELTTFRDSSNNSFFKSVGRPEYHDDSVEDEDPDSETFGKLFPAVTIYPRPKAAVENGIMVRYEEIPPDMTEDDEKPVRIPPTAHHLICLDAIVEIWEQKRDMKNASFAEQKRSGESAKFFNNFMPSPSGHPAQAIPMTATYNRRGVFGNRYSDRSWKK